MERIDEPKPETQYPVARFPGLCEDLFLIQHQIHFNIDPDTCENVRKTVSAKLDDLEIKAADLNIPDEDIQDVIHALTYSIDEEILYSAWDGKAEWVKKPLQLLKFGQNTGGVDFFNTLETLLEKEDVPKWVLAVRLYCLLLGFQGKYRILGKENLKELTCILKDRVFVDEKVLPLSMLPETRPLVIDKKPPAKKEPVKFPVWMPPAVSAAVMLFVFVILWFSLNGNVSTTLTYLS